MTHFMNRAFCRAILMIAMAMPSVSGCNSIAELERAERQVRRIVAELDRRTTPTGVYIRVQDGELKETDPWGTRIQVKYAQGGVAETVTVRSAGPDRQFLTRDDIHADGLAVNFKGVGEGIKKNAGEVAANTAKGFVKGTVAGIKESVKEALPFKKKKPKDEEPQPAAAD